MWKRSIILLVLLIALVGCSGESKEKKEAIPLTIEPIDETAESIGRLLGFVSNESLAYVTEKEDRFQLIEANIRKGTKRLVYETEDPIVEAWIHPLRSHYVVHIAREGEEQLQLVDEEGRVERHVPIEASEVYVAPHPSDPLRLAFTLFSSDWTYDVFVYDGDERFTKFIGSPFPFPKWDGDELIGISERQVGEETTLLRYDREEERVMPLSKRPILDTVVKGSDRVDVVVERDEFVYYVNEERAWTSPLVTSFGEPFVLPFGKVEEGWVAIRAHEPHALEEEGASYELILVTNEGEQQLADDWALQMKVHCASRPLHCLAGESYERVWSADGERAWTSE